MPLSRKDGPVTILGERAKLRLADFGANSATGNAAAASEADGGEMLRPHTPSEAVLRAHRTSDFLRFRKYGAKPLPAMGSTPVGGRIIP